jgi:hypothetical protein
MEQTPEKKKARREHCRSSPVGVGSRLLQMGTLGLAFLEF